MDLLRGCVAGCVALLLIGGVAQADKKDDALKALQGKWQMSQRIGDKGVKGVLSFGKDNKLTLRFEDIGIEGKYKLIDEKTLEVTLTFMDKSQTDQSTFKIAGDTLELTSSKGNVEKFKRLK